MLTAAITMPRMTEAPILPDRRENRATLRRLFQAYVDDFGPEAGEQIIMTTINELGGMRMVIPTNSHHNGANIYAIRVLYARMCERFGDASGAVIMRKFLVELGGIRISFPDMEDLWREERNRKIRAAYNGSNHAELAIKWGMSVVHVRNIIRGE